MRAAVFLDRDGVIIADKGYMHRISDFNLLNGAAEAIAKLNAAGFLVIVVSNQSGIARGYFKEKDLEIFNSYMISELKRYNARIDGAYYCPHHPNGIVTEYRKSCDCRKPKTGMLIQAAKDHDIELAKSWMVGDKESDAVAGNSAGCSSILLCDDRSGIAEYRAKDLADAVTLILTRK